MGTWKLVAFNENELIIRKAEFGIVQQVIFPNIPAVWDYVGFSPKERELLLKNSKISNIVFNDAKQIASQVITELGLDRR